MRHYIRDNKSEAMPTAIVVIDTEGTPVPLTGRPNLAIHYLRHCSASYWRIEGGRRTREVTLETDDYRALWDWLYDRLDRRRSTWVWGHGIGYDLQILRVWEEIEAGRLLFFDPQGPIHGSGTGGKRRRPWRGCLVTGDPPTILSCRTPRGQSIRILDILNWANIPLSEIAAMLGMDMPPPLGEDATEADVREACQTRRDVAERAVEGIMGMVADQALGQFRLTIASQAYHAWRHPSLPCRILPTEPGPARDRERAAYYGCGCHVRYQGQVLPPGTDWAPGLAGALPLMPILYSGPVYHLDVTACYGAVMRDGVYPTVYRRTLDTVPLDRLGDVLAAHGVIALARIDSTTEVYPVRREGQTLYRAGKFDTILPGPELALALANDDLVSVHDVQIYTLDRPFRDICDRLWRIRQVYQMASRPLEARLAKVMLAVLHGKLAQRPERWEFVPELLAPQPWGVYAADDSAAGTIVMRRAIGARVQQLLAQDEGETALPAIAAYVTSYARMLMRDLCLTAGMRDCLYSDADSLHVTQSGYDRLVAYGRVRDQEMGYCRVEQVAKHAIYHGPKDYQLDDRIVRVGKQRLAVQTPRGDWRQTDFQRLDNALAGDPPPGPLAMDRTLQITHHPIDARVGGDGWTSPIVEG